MRDFEQDTLLRHGRSKGKGGPIRIAFLLTGRDDDAAGSFSAKGGDGSLIQQDVFKSETPQRNGKAFPRFRKMCLAKGKIPFAKPVSGAQPGGQGFSPPIVQAPGA